MKKVGLTIAAIFVTILLILNLLCDIFIMKGYKYLFIYKESFEETIKYEIRINSNYINVITIKACPTLECKKSTKIMKIKLSDNDKKVIKEKLKYNQKITIINNINYLDKFKKCLISQSIKNNVNLKKCK